MNHSLQHDDLSNAHNATYIALRPLSSPERLRIIESVLALLGEDTRVLATATKYTSSPKEPHRTSSSEKHTASNSTRAFFEAKRPLNKAEEYVVAAALLKKTTGKATFSKDDLARMIEEAGRSFNRDKFKRDFENARAAGLLSRDARSNTLTLLPRGQQYVDQLPQRPTSSKTPKRKNNTVKNNTNKQAKKANLSVTKPQVLAGKTVAHKKQTKSIAAPAERKTRP